MKSNIEELAGTVVNKAAGEMEATAAVETSESSEPAVDTTATTAATTAASAAATATAAATTAAATAATATAAATTAAATTTAETAETAATATAAATAATATATATATSETSATATLATAAATDYYPDGKHYNSFVGYYRRRYGERVQKLVLDAGFSCPNRDGTVGWGGCSYCDNAAFHPGYTTPGKALLAQIEEGIEFQRVRYPRVRHYLGYFQAYSNTYGTLERLQRAYEEVLSHPEVVGIVIGTRPDCVDEEKLDYLSGLAGGRVLKGWRRTFGGSGIDGGWVNERSADSGSGANGGWANERSADSGSGANGWRADDRSTNDRSTDDRSTNSISANSISTNSISANGRSANSISANSRSTNGGSIDDRSTNNGSADGGLPEGKTIDAPIVVVEYGIESCYDATLRRINRGHDFECARRAVEMTAERGLDTGAHFILGLPGETREMLLDQCDAISSLPLRSVKFHQLQIVKGTAMEKEYAADPSAFYRPGLDEYLDFVIDILERLRPDLYIERVAGEVPPRFVNDTPWGLVRNFEILRMLDRRMEERGARQGRLFSK